MSDHVVTRMAEFFQGELVPQRKREIEEHLEHCEECSADFAWVDRLREQALRDGLRHLLPLRIVELAAAGEDDATEAEREHLQACRSCRGETAWARKDLDSPEAGQRTAGRPPVEPLSARPIARISAVRWVWIGLAAAALLILFFVIPRGPGSEITGSARIERMEAQVPGGTFEPGSFEEIRRLGLKAYAGADYAGATEHLERAAEMRPDDAEVLLYLGSAKGLLDKKDAAANRLRQAVEAAPSPMIRREALWQLANVDLAAGRVAEARVGLERLVERPGRRQSEAVELLGALPAD